MIYDQFDRNPGLRILFTVAVGFILIHGLRFTQPVLLPVATATFLAVICLPIVLWLSSRRVPLAISVVITVLAVAGGFGLLILVGSQQTPELRDRLVTLIEAALPQLGPWTAQIEDWVPLLDEGELRAFIEGEVNAEFLTGWVTDLTTWALSFLTSTFLVVLILVFALGEAAVLPRKLQLIAGGGVPLDERFRKIIAEVQGYLVIKTLISIATGVLLGLWAWFMGLDLPILLGLFASLLNYIPTIGSIIASVPALILAGIDIDPVTLEFAGMDFQHAAIVGLGYLTVNVFFGNWLEPTLLGRHLGLSTLIVVVSLFFWGWLWGPLGALLSVPLTMVVKIMLANTPDLRWMAVLLGKTPPPEPAPGEPDSPPEEGSPA